MGALDFLFEGKAPPSVATSNNETRTVPSWLSDYAQGLLARANQIAGEPYATYTGPRIAGFDPLQTRSQDLAGSSVGNWQGATGAASGAYSDVLGSPGALAQAMPFLDRGTGSYTDNVDKYMNPYVENVIDRSTQLAQRALSEKLMPSINKNFITSGAYGSAGQQRAVGQALRDVTGELQSQHRAALADAYNSGANLFESEAGRNLQGAQGVGSLYGQDVTSRLNAASGLGALGRTVSDLTGTDLSRLSAAGKERQDLNQANLRLAYEDWLAQRDYPKNQANWLASLLPQLPNMGGTTTSHGTAPAQIMGPSVAGQIGSTIGAIGGGLDLWERIFGKKDEAPAGSGGDTGWGDYIGEIIPGVGGHARGGLTRYARGGMSRYPMRGGLRYARGGRVRRPVEGGLTTYRRIRHG